MLYMVWGSPPVNAVLMTAKALNIDLELHEVDFKSNEYLSDWFLEVRFVIWDFFFSKWYRILVESIPYGAYFRWWWVCFMG